MNLLITGASGFIGGAIKNKLKNLNHNVMGTGSKTDGDIVSVPLETANWYPVLHNVEIVIHCAALAHVPSSSDPEFIQKVRNFNVEATRRLASQAKLQGIKRFIFLSSVKVLGEITDTDEKFSSQSDYDPKDLYGESKRDAELILKKELQGSSVELVIIRPPLVYGPGVKGNFKALKRLAKRNLPLPFGSVNNKRSMVALDNLTDLIVTCVAHPSPLNGIFLVSDDESVSTKRLLETLTLAYGKKPRLWRFPVSLMRLAVKLVGKRSISVRLFDNLELDISHTKRTLSWKPVVRFSDAIERCVTHDFQKKTDT